MNKVDILIITIGAIISIGIFIVLLILFFRKERELEYLIVCYVADKGAGKTTLASAIADYFHRKYEPLVRQDLEPIISIGKNNGFGNIDLPQDTLLFADTDVWSSVSEKNKKEYIKAYDCDINKFRLPTDNNHKLIDYYPFGSYLIFDEIANKAMSRDFQNFSKNLTAMLNLTRKFYYNINFIWPDYMGTDKIIRNSCHIIRLVKGSEIELDKKGNIIGMKWWFIDYSGANRIENFQNNIVPATPYKPFKIFMKKRPEICKWYFHYKGDISNLCNTRAEILYMLNHFTKWTLKRQRNYTIKRKDVIDFCKNNPAFADNLADVMDNRTIAEKRKGIYKQDKEQKND